MRCLSRQYFTIYVYVLIHLLCALSLTSLFHYLCLRVNSFIVIQFQCEIFATLIKNWSHKEKKKLLMTMTHLVILKEKNKEKYIEKIIKKKYWKKILFLQLFLLNFYFVGFFIWTMFYMNTQFVLLQRQLALSKSTRMYVSCYLINMIWHKSHFLKFCVWALSGNRVENLHWACTTGDCGRVGTNCCCEHELPHWTGMECVRVNR